MTRIEEIIKEARYALADPDKQRYTDERLLSALNNGQKDIARQTRLLKGEVDIPLDVNEATYSLPEDLWLIERVHFRNVKIPLMSHDRMDDFSHGWYTRYSGNVEAIVYDKRNMHKIRVYPRPDDSYISAEFDFLPENPLANDSNSLTPAQIVAMRALAGSLVTLTNPTPFNLAPVYNAASEIINITPPSDLAQSTFGVVTSMPGSILSNSFGVVSDIALADNFEQWPGRTVFDSVFGVATAMELTNGTLHIYYIKDSAKVVSVQQELEVSPIFDAALRYYVIGQAFGDDLDTVNQEKSMTALNMYDRELVTVGTPTDETDGTRATQYTGTYMGAFSS